jgi:alpha-galactosidase
MKFGLWFEPEMVSPDSDLYRNHPDWCIHVQGRDRTESRNQLVLDFSRAEVCNYVSEMILGVLKNAPISYVKWDMNRNMTEIGSLGLPAERQRETAHRYILGLYSVLEKITKECPHILFESCAGGGGPFDPGMLYYMPQTWTSDNTDAIERLKIQYGTSIVYPISTMGAHVSVSPNHFGGRTISLKTRGNVAMSGNFGYELDLTKFSEEEKNMVKEQVKLYKELRELIQFGEFYRLLSPFEGNETAWMFVDEAKKNVFAVYIRVLKETNGPSKKLKLKGLDSDKNYRLLETGEVYGGDELMHAGINIPRMDGDFESMTWRLEVVE